MTTEDRSNWREHLTTANQIRLRRAAIRAEIKSLPHSSGRLALASLIEDPPPEILSADVRGLLTWPRRSGTDFARKTLEQAGVARLETFVPLSSLTDRERKSLACVLRREKAERA